MQSASSRIWTRVDVSISYDEVQSSTKVTKVSMMQLAQLKVAQPKLMTFRPQICLCWTMPAEVLANSKLMPLASSPSVASGLIVVKRLKCSTAHIVLSEFELLSRYSRCWATKSSMLSSDTNHFQGTFSSPHIISLYEIWCFFNFSVSTEWRPIPSIVHFCNLWILLWYHKSISHVPLPYNNPNNTVKIRSFGNYIPAFLENNIKPIDFDITDN